MVELVDTLDLGSSAFGRAGSSPVSGNPACQDKHVEVVIKTIQDVGSNPTASNLIRIQDINRARSEFSMSSGLFRGRNGIDWLRR